MPHRVRKPTAVADGVPSNVVGFCARADSVVGYQRSATPVVVRKVNLLSLVADPLGLVVNFTDIQGIVFAPYPATHL